MVSFCKTVSTTVEVIEHARDFGPMRTMAKADATVAEAIVGNRIADSDLDVALKREQLVEARLRNERLALEVARWEQALTKINNAGGWSNGRCAAGRSTLRTRSGRSIRLCAGAGRTEAAATRGDGALEG